MQPISLKFEVNVQDHDLTDTIKFNIGYYGQ